MKNKTTKNICGVTVWKTSKKQDDYFLKYSKGGSVMQRSHVNWSDSDHTQVCYRNLNPAMKPAIRNEIAFVSHAVSSCGKSKTAVCCLLDNEGNHWKAPSHKVGECPFFIYRPAKEEN